MTEEFKKIFGDNLKENEPLSKHLVFRVGGPAKWWAIAKSVDQIKQAISVCNEHKIEWIVLGGGSNLLAADDGFNGLVMKVGMMDVKINDLIVEVDAGLPAVALARKVADEGLSGIEWMVSLPGTVGGAVRGNAGCFGGETKDFIKKVTVLRGDALVELGLEDLKFGYRDSLFKQDDNQDIILSAEFKLSQDDPMAIKERMHLVLDKRKNTQPMSSGTAGCTFKNFDIPSDEEGERLREKTEIPKEMIDTGRVSAGWLIDSLDMKGEKIGGAQISEEHANFIINDGTATADDIIQLISVIKTRVRNTFGIQLEEEIKYLGF